MEMTSYYTAEPVDGQVTVIRSLTGELLYLIEGDERAVLVDTCLGVGHLRRFVEGLTDKPLTVLLTHGHIDHAMGAPEFDEVYMSHADAPVYLSMRQVEGRLGYIRLMMDGQLPELDQDGIIPPSEMNFRDLKDGDVFDLGGLHVEAHALPGHTPGSMVLLIAEKRTLILGDACNGFTFLFDENSSTVEEYREQLLAIQKRLRGRYDRIYLSHGEAEFPVELLDGVIGVCDDILSGNVDDVPFAFMGRSDAWIAKAMGEDMKRKDGGLGNIVYNKDKVRR